MSTSQITIFGIRHHGPGCARSLRSALHALTPDIVLVEGPPDATDVLPLLMHQAMRPPVALLIYMPDRPRQAAYYPFTVFSPEWQALRYAFERGIPARFIDLPQAMQMSAPKTDGAADVAPGLDRESAPNAVTVEEPPSELDEPAPPALAGEPSEAGTDDDGDIALRDDPIGMLAKLAGYQDRELWWEHQVEQRQDATDLFEAILEVMATLRAAAPPADPREAQREAYMRQAIRAAQKEGFTSIAVVCGAWHAPVLAPLGHAKPDAALLAGLPRANVTATWIPWTNSRLAARSGYGAGIASPGWYEHVWQEPERTAIRWVTHAARLLRERDLDASSASVIEAVRLGDALAALRGLPMPGLAELNEAILTVLCHGEQAPMTLIRDRLEIGDRLGEVPDETPAVPLHRDLTALQRRLRMQPTAEIRPLDLDLRNNTDRERSRLLHRLHVLDVPWGMPQHHGGKTSTFHELWQLQWRPEFAVGLIDASIWGNTVESAATSSICHAASGTAELPALSILLDNAILAALPAAVQHILLSVQAKAALASDLRHLMDALPGLARVARYGDVRETPAEQVVPVIDGLFERVVTGLANACASLDDDAATAMVESIGHVQSSIGLLDRPEQLQEWREALRALIDRDGIHGLVRGWACRLLLEARELDDDQLQTLARLALSPANPSTQAAAWVEGVLRGSGLLLLHQDGLWRALDRWLSGLSEDGFTDTLPLLRRAFSGFQAPERRGMGGKVARLRAGGRSSTVPSAEALEIDHERAATVLPILAQILGVEYRPAARGGDE
jgi:Family of unknown function (DUF5682)